MTDQKQPMDPFEAKVARLMANASDRALRPFDATAMARSVAERGPISPVHRIRTRWPRRPLLVLAFAALGGAAAAGILISGDRRADVPPPSIPPSPNVAVVEPSTAASTPDPLPSTSAAPATTPDPSGTAALPTFTSCLGDAGASGSDGPTEGWATPAAPPPRHPKNGRIAGFVGTHIDGAPGPNAGLIVLDPTDGAAARIADLAPDLSGRPDLAWSPLGDAIAVTTHAGSGLGLGSCNAVDVLVGDRVSHLTSRGGGGSFLWSPDGRSIAVFDGGPIRTYHADGTAVPDLAACGDSCSFDSPLWSPGGDWLVVRSLGNDGTETSLLISIATGAISDLPRPHGLANAGPLAWLDASTLLMMAVSPSGNARFAAVGLDGSVSKADVGVDAMDIQTLATAPDFSAAAGVACLRCPFVVSSGGVTRTIWDGPDPVAQAWSPDSRWLAFSARGGASTAGTWVVRADGGGSRRLSTRVLDPIAWGPAPP